MSATIAMTSKSKTLTVARARAKNLPVSPQKGRIVADLIRGLSVTESLECLQFRPQKAAKLISKVINSAMASANESEKVQGIDAESLIISHIDVSEGMRLKRVRFGARGRVSRITRRRSHIVLELGENIKRRQRKIKG